MNNLPESVLDNSFDSSYTLPFNQFVEIFKKNAYKHCKTKQDENIYNAIYSSNPSLEKVNVIIEPAFISYDIYDIVNTKRFSGFTIRYIEQNDYIYKGKRKSQVGSPRENFDSLIKFLDDYEVDYDEDDIEYFKSLSYPVYAYTGLTSNLILEYILVEYESIFHNESKKTFLDYTDDDDDKVYLAVHEFIKTITMLRRQSLYSIHFDYSKINDENELKVVEELLSPWEGDVFIRK